jgi:hypothetical protein
VWLSAAGSQKFSDIAGISYGLGYPAAGYQQIPAAGYQQQDTSSSRDRRDPRDHQPGYMHALGKNILSYQKTKTLYTPIS